jgi:hypothetical protein
MASAKGGGTTRRSRSSKTPKKNEQPEVSPARWAGVALVIAAIVGAVFLAVISPSDSDGPGQPGAQVAEVESTGLIDDASPSPSVLDMAVPVVAPDIVVPEDGTRTREYEFEVTVAVPNDRTVKRQNLDLDIYINGKHSKALRKPKPGTEVEVEGVRLAPGKNVLTAVLSSPGGRGPASEPITVVLDEELPPLEIVSPKNKLRTYDDKVTVEVTSEVGASVTIDNKANDHDWQVPIGPAGKASKSIRLAYGKNLIEATSVDEAGQDVDYSVTVIRLDGRPKIKLKFPESVNPPEQVRIVAEVKDAKKQPMKDADVLFTLTAPNMSTLTLPATTNAKGRAVWEVEIPASSSPAAALELGVTVTSPTGDKDKDRATIEVK